MTTKLSSPPTVSAAQSTIASAASVTATALQVSQESSFATSVAPVRADTSAPATDQSATETLETSSAESTATNSATTGDQLNLLIETSTRLVTIGDISTQYLQYFEICKTKFWRLFVNFLPLMIITIEFAIKYRVYNGTL